MNTKHTPGPWRATRANAQTMPFQYDPPAVFAGDLKPVAVVHYGGSYAGSEEAEANARLIAAAPELAEAVRGILSLIENPDECGFAYSDDKEVEFARAVLAKIGGAP